MGKILWEGVGSNFAETFQVLVHFRGLSAERELICVLSEKRMAQLYDGDEPRFSEVLEIARILRVPLSSFQIFERGDFAELEIAFADIMYAACEMNSNERQHLAQRMCSLVAPKPVEQSVKQTLLAKRDKA